MGEQVSIGSVMTHYPYFVDSHSSLNSAKLMFNQYGVRHLPVKNGDALIGVIARMDLDRAEITGASASTASKITVADVCRKSILVVEHDEPLKNVLEKMVKQHLECVFVNDKNVLVGIFTVTDACRGYAMMLDQPG